MPAASAAAQRMLFAKELLKHWTTVREQETNFKVKKKSERTSHHPAIGNIDAMNPNCPSLCASPRTGGSFDQSSNPFFFLVPFLIQLDLRVRKSEQNGPKRADESPDISDHSQTPKCQSGIEQPAKDLDF